MRLIGLRWVFALTFMMTGSTAAMACSNGVCWGAVGVGPGGAWGNAYDYPSERAAAQVAQNNCGGRCTTVKTFYNTCGAIAQGDGGGWG